MLRGNRHARQQLTAAFPTLSSRKTDRLLRGMWDNLGRTIGEYAHISELMQFSAETPVAGQVIMDERSAETVRYISQNVRGALMFGAHLANWEIPAMAAHAAGREIALTYKRQPSAVLTAGLRQKRGMFAARLIEASSAAPREMLRALRDGLLVGMLVDQHYPTGIDVPFLGRTCRVNPLLALLARTGDWPIYGARVVRLPDQRYRLEVVELQLPREAQSRIDVGTTMQAAIGMVEAWIRQEPEEWMWIHTLIRANSLHQGK